MLDTMPGGLYTVDRGGRITRWNRAMELITGYGASEAVGQPCSLLQGDTCFGKSCAGDTQHCCSLFDDGSIADKRCGIRRRDGSRVRHVRGAFTGAVASRKGRFEAADGGRLLPDEVGDVSMTVQTKLLRVLQEREFERVGDNRPIRVDIRVLAASNRDLLSMEGFRRDLSYRLAVIPVHVPALRERASDIPLLVDHFVSRLNRTLAPCSAPVVTLRLDRC